MIARPDRHPALLRAADALLVVIDMQEPFLRTIWERERVERNARLLIDGSRALHVPVIATLQYARRLGGPVPSIQAALPPGLALLDKLCFSCAGDDAFAAELRRSARKQILLCGVETHICVCQTALDLVAQGYEVHVAADSVSSRTKSNWRVGLAKMEGAGVHVSSAEMALFEMLVEAGTPEFKEIIALAK